MAWLESISYLNNVQHNVFVEAVQDALSNSVVIPGTMDQQEVLQILKLSEGRHVEREGEKEKESG